MKETNCGHLGYKHVALYVNTITTVERAAMIYLVSKLVNHNLNTHHRKHLKSF